MQYYTCISYYNDCPDFESYDSIEDAIEAYQTSIDQAHDKALGDVSRISYGVTKANKNTRIASYDFD
jgi:hypothetical protein